MWINDLKDKVDALERQVIRMLEYIKNLERRITALESAVIKPDE